MLCLPLTPVVCALSALAVQRLFWLSCAACDCRLARCGLGDIHGFCGVCFFFKHRRLTPQSSGTSRWCASPLTFDVRHSQVCMKFKMTEMNLEKKRKIVMLILTENCNLSCVYCFEKAKTKAKMSLQIAKSAVEYELNNSDQFDEIEFDLFGGEPTLCKPLIQELVEWTNDQGFQKPYLFFIDTNGTLVHGQFQDWLIRHKEYVYVGLSLDGTPETHNINRDNSYDRIDIKFFLKNYPEQPVRMTINSNTIGTLSKDVIYLHGLGFSSVVATFAHGIVWDKNKIKNELKEELYMLCSYYLEHPEISECSIFDMQLPRILQKEQPIGKWCGTGTSMVSFGVDGTKYPCHTFQSNTGAAIKAVKLGEIDFDGISDFSYHACSSCILEPICPNCYGMNYVTNGHILSRDMGLCEIVKVRALAVSYLRAKQLEKNSTRMRPNETYQTIAAIEAIQSQFTT